MEEMNDNDLLEEVARRFRNTKKALHDVTVMNEKIEKLNIKLMESERLKSDFLSNIRNEINNPLTSILGMARQLAGPMQDEKAKQVMSQMIYSEAFDLDFQLRNIFMAAEVEAGEATPGSAQVDILSLVKSIIASLEHKTCKKNIRVMLAAREEQDQNLYFVTDPEKMRVVITNLLANAIEFSPGGGQVTVETRKQNGTLFLSVADQGAGIPAAERDRLFERFRQLDRGSAKKHRGHGLGLCITKSILNMLGGTVAVADGPGGGTRIEVAIPEAEKGDAAVFSEDGNDFIFGGGTF